jgi:hypothetical protein
MVKECSSSLALTSSTCGDRLVSWYIRLWTKSHRVWFVVVVLFVFNIFNFSSVSVTVDYNIFPPPSQGFYSLVLILECVKNIT